MKVEFSAVNLSLKVGFHRVHLKDSFSLRYFIPTWHRTPVKSAWTLSRETGTQPNGPSSTSLRSSDVFWLYHSQSRVSMKRLAENLWEIITLSANMPVFTHRFMQNPMQLRRRSFANANRKKLNNKQMKKDRHNKLNKSHNNYNRTSGHHSRNKPYQQVFSKKMRTK